MSPNQALLDALDAMMQPVDRVIVLERLRALTAWIERGGALPGVWSGAARPPAPAKGYWIAADV